MILSIAVLAGLGIGLSLGMLGSGGSILAVPVLIYLLGQSPAQAMTGSLVVVGITAILAGAAAYRQGRVNLSEGLAFGALAISGALIGALAAARVAEVWLMAAFSVLLLVVAALMARNSLRAPPPTPAATGVTPEESPTPAAGNSTQWDLARALKVCAVAMAVGLLTGFLGVGGGFLVVPALVLALGMPMAFATGTSLVVISITSASALIARVQHLATPDWGLVALLAASSVAGSLVGARLVSRVSQQSLKRSFTVLLIGVASYTAYASIPPLFAT